MRYLAILILFGVSTSGFAQTGKIKTDGTQCATLPCVVASLSLTDQTQSVSNVPILTSSVSGLFRVSFYMDSSRIRGSIWHLVFNWTDDLRPRQTGSYIVNAGNEAFSQFPVRGVAGQPITYTVNEQTNIQATYDLFIAVEQVQ